MYFSQLSGPGGLPQTCLSLPTPEVSPQHAHSPGPNFTSWGHQPLPQQYHSRAHLQIPTVLPSLAMGHAEAGPPTGPCPRPVSSIPVPREVPGTWGWDCPTVPPCALLPAGEIGWSLPARPCPAGPQGDPATHPGEPMGPPAPWQFFSCSYPFFHFSLLHFAFSCVSAFREYLCLISLKAGSAGAFRCLMKQTWTSGIFHTAWALQFYWKLSAKLFFPPYFTYFVICIPITWTLGRGWVGCKPETRWQISPGIWRKGETDWSKG